MKLNLKVFTNSRNGQPSVALPKKLFKRVPQNVIINISQQYVKQKFLRGK
jgi:hypothetical protein